VNTGFMEAAAQLNLGPSLPWLSDRRENGKRTFAQQPLPTRRTEAWKYTNLQKLVRGMYLRAADKYTDQAVVTDDYIIPDLNVCTVVFVDGQYKHELSSKQPPEGCELVTFSNATDIEAARIKEHLGCASNRAGHLFTSLNDSWLTDGVFLRVKAHANIEQAIQLVWLSTPAATPFCVSQRLLVVLEEGSNATIIEHFCSTEAPQTCFTNGLTEILLAESATLHHYRLQFEEENALHIGGIHANLQANAELNSFHAGMGSALKRVDAVVNFLGEGAHSNLKGIYLPRRHQHVDYHICLEHIAPRCTSAANFRGIISDEARAVFNGRIHIHPDAQKSVARLDNKNLLTSNKAEIDTKPELEIYADDVQCAHGATVAQLDDEALYYLMSRGINQQDAVTMLSYGFINELIDSLHSETIGRYVRHNLLSVFDGHSISAQASHE